MSNSNNLIINLVGRTVQFSSSIINVSKTVDGLQKRLSGITSAFSSLGKTALASFGPLAGMIGIGFGVKLAAEAETAKVGFSTMLGSAEKAQILLNQLKSFAASTPFEFPELRTAAQSLLSFGVDAGAIQSRLKTLGDVASGSSSSIEDLALIYGKTLAKGKFELEQGNQLAERGIPIYSTLAKQLGKTQPELMKMISAGKVSAAHVQQAFETMAGAGGIFENAMEKQSQTIAGKWSTFVDNIKQVATGIGEFIIDAFGIGDLLSTVNDATGSITQTLESWKPVALSVRGVLIAAFGAIQSALTALASSFATLLSPVLTFLTENFGKTMTDWRDSVVSIFAAIEWSITNWSRIWELVFNQAWLTLLTWKENIVNIFTNVIPTIFNNFGESIKQFFFGLADNIAKVVTELWGYISTFGEDQIQIEWTPLIIDEVAKAFDRQLTEQEKALSETIKRQKDALATDLGNFVNKKVDDVKKTGKEVEAKLEGKAGYDQTEEAKNKKQETGLKAVTRGSEAAASAIIGANKISAEAKELVKTNQMLKENHKTLKAIEKNTKGNGLAKAKL